METRLIKSEKKIRSFIEKLATTLLPPETPTATIKKITSYSQNLLKSSFPKYKTSPNEEISSVRTSLVSTTAGETKTQNQPPSIEVVKTITKIYKNKKKKKKEEVFERANTLIYNLSKSHVLKKKAAILSLLNSLSRNKSESEDDFNKSRLLEILEKKTKEKNDRGGMKIEICDLKKIRVFDQEKLIDRRKTGRIEEEGVEEREKEDKEKLILDLIQLLKIGKSDYIEENKNTGVFRLKIKLKVRPQILTLILNLAEISKTVIFLRTKLSQYSQSNISPPNCKTRNSFIIPLSKILEDFDNFLDSIEDSKVKETSIFGDQDKSINSKFISVMTLYTIMQEPLMKMVNTAIIIDSVENINDDHILSSLYTYFNCGNIRLRKISKFFIEESVKPLIDFLLLWINEGEIEDEFMEFFIRKNFNRRTKIWENDCEIVYNKIPSLIGQEIAEILFKMGLLKRFVKKMGLKFIMEDLDLSEGAMVVEYLDEVEIEKINGIDLNFALIPQEEMKCFLYDHYLKHAKMLIKCYIRESSFLQNFEFLHKTFFMRNGDFFDSLLHELDPVLSQKASEVYFHEVMPLFRSISEKSSIRNIGLIKGKGRTVLGAELLDRFGLKFLEKNDGDSGWDIFCLEFRFSDLMRHIITEEIELKLQRLSHFLIKLRRLYYKMNSIWILQKKVLKARDILPSAYELIVKCNLMRTHMSQFITNINSYVFYEVIASEYQKFINEIKKSKDLDDLRKKTERLMDELLRRCFLQKNENFDKNLKAKTNLFYGGNSTNTAQLVNPSGRGSQSIQESITNLLKHVEKFSNSFTKIHGYLYTGNGKMNKYFPIKPSVNLISEVWEEYDNEYYHFLSLIESSCEDYGLEASSFKFDFNYFHVNQYEKKIGMRYFEKIANTKKVVLEQEEKSNDDESEEIYDEYDQDYDEDPGKRGNGNGHYFEEF